MKTSTSTSSRADLYTRVTDRVIADLENGVRPWLKPWNAEHASGRITLPLRYNGTPCRGINILLLCLRLQRGGGVRGWGRDGLGTGA
jgi:antirestriction protein ArdC